MLTAQRVFGRADVGDDDACWEWQGALNDNGYGFLSDSKGKSPVLAHRAAVHLVRGLTEGLQLDHLCRNRACINPRHLEEVTGVVNTQRGLGGPRLVCIAGHPYEGENIYVYKRPDGKTKRFCRACRNRRRTELYHRSK